MNRKDARKIAETITNEQIQQMFDNAKANITDWTKVSSVNKGLTKGAGWNILAKNFDINYNHHILAKRNMVREFGDYLPKELKPEKQVKVKSKSNPMHQNPEFRDSIDELFKQND